MFKKIVLLLLLLTISPVIAQQATCPALVLTALEELDSNCADVALNDACYGHQQVTATFSEQVEPEFFTQPADIANLLILDQMQTSPLDLNQNDWGIAVMRVQGNIPNTLPGQVVTFLLMGETEVSNAVPAEEAFIPVDPLTLTVSSDAAIFSEPIPTSTVLGTVAVGDEVQADARNTEGDWVRIIYLDQPAWLNINNLQNTSDVEDLPIGTLKSPAQAFFFNTGVGQLSCTEAPNVLAIRSPENRLVDLNINGADVQIGSTIVLRNISEDEVAITVQEGHLDVIDTGQRIVTGETITALLNDDATIDEWQESRPVTEEEISIMESVENAFAMIEDESTTTAEGEIIHIVQARETLFSIATLYDASMPAIIDRNGLSDPRNIIVGQELIIPNPGSGFVNLPNITPTIAPTVVTTVESTIDCSTFRATSPLNGLAYGQNTFFWDGVAGATSYLLVITNIDEQRTTSIEATGTSVSTNVDQATLGGGFNFAWEVVALLDGEIKCSTGNQLMQRGSAPIIDPVTPPTAPTTTAPILTGTWTCIMPSEEASISYSGAGDGEEVFISYTILNVADGSVSETVQSQHSGPSGTFSIGLTGPSDLSAGSITTRSGQNVMITPRVLSCK